jgi:hypothetical protein
MAYESYNIGQKGMPIAVEKPYILLQLSSLFNVNPELLFRHFPKIQSSQNLSIPRQPGV